MGKYEEALERAKAGKPLDEVFPELKESEDERIRKWLVEYFKSVSKSLIHRDMSPEQVIAYLERQKEQKPNIELIQKSWYLEGYHDGKYNNESKWLIQTGKEGPRYEENQKYGTQQPAEWSLDDRIQYDSIKSGIEAFSETYSFNIESQLTPSLSEEQMKIWRREIEQAVIAGGEMGIELKNDNRYEENKIPVEWSEEDEHYFQNLIMAVDSTFSEGNTKNWLQNRFKSLRPQPHWKPSAEQMEALNSIILTGSFTYVDQTQDLISLKDDLKKLI